ncbi:MAG: glycoside hydrolase family 78 protein [Bacteroidales bacterium]|nr:glycoside hydrolase family 78 protein [Bacteroidales bacterium]
MLKMRTWRLVLLSVLFFASCSDGVDVRILNPTVDLKSDPIGVTSANPSFSWQLSSELKDVSQTYYRIIVASSEKALKKNEGDLWDSGEVESGQSTLIRYDGKPLGSRDRAYWKVKVKTNRGETAWSRPGVFEIALLDGSDWTASWIGHHPFQNDEINYLERYPWISYERIEERHTTVPARYLRKEFSTGGRKVRKARLYICGLGLYEAYINGVKVDDENCILKPTTAEYDRTVPYNTFDVTSLIKKHNTVGVILGNGRYVSVRSRILKHYDLPKLILQLEIEYSDGSRDTVVSDTSWKITNDGPIRSNNDWDGEYYDARLEMPGWDLNGFDDGRWLRAELVDAPKGELRPQLNPDIRIQDVVKPVELFEFPGDTVILDIGQNMVGWLQLKGRARAGDTVHVRYAESLDAAGRLYTANFHTAKAASWYVAKDDEPFTWHPQFIFQGFRFVEVTGLKDKPSLEDFEGQVSYDEMKNTGTFECSDELLNQIHKNAFWGIRGNYRGIPTDCPQRDERMGWTGDRTVGVLGESYMFGNHDLYAKWLGDIEDTQKESGAISEIAPAYVDLYTDDNAWCGAYLTVADMLYTQYGDSKPIELHYDSMKRWMDYMKEKFLVDGVMTNPCIGDWCVPPETRDITFSQDPSRTTPCVAITTPFYYYLTTLMRKFARVLGKEEDALAFDVEARMVKDSYNRKYLNGKGYYSTNSVTANLLPLRFGMVPDEYRDAVVRSTVDRVVNDFDSHVCCGVVGNGQMMRALTDNGHGDLAYTIASNKTYPGWGYMIGNGATTIWELWNGDTAGALMNSQNHVMLLGDLIIWMYRYIGGIGNAEGSVGYERVRLKPYLVKGLDYARVSYDSVRGTIVSSWKKEDGKFLWDIVIPANSTAEVFIPSVSLDGDEVKDLEGLGGKLLREDSGYTVFGFPSGSYSLSVNYGE